MDHHWNLLCGESIQNGPNISHTEGLPNISLPGDDACFVNFISAIPHILFLLISTLTLICLTCCRTYSSADSAYFQKLPYHTFRWLFLLTFLLLCGCSIAEGILTDLTYQDIATTQPHLYVPQCFVFLAVICSLVHFQHSEVWGDPRLSWITLIYWLLACIVEVAKVRTYSNVVSPEEIHLIFVFRIDIAIASALVYFIMILLECIVLCSKVSFNNGLGLMMNYSLNQTKVDLKSWDVKFEHYVA